jgi:UDP-N-acetylmuramate--alanine ligase
LIDQITTFIKIVNTQQSKYMKVGIIFGGPSREREIAFAGGRTVYDNLNKALFEAIPIFVDSLGNFILLDWQYLYKGTIRDFYPPSTVQPRSKFNFQAYIESLEIESQADLDKMMQAVGTPISASELRNYIEFAFLSLHGEWGEDGQIQGLLESLGIPYSGSGIRASSIGMDKSFQKKIMAAGGFHSPEMEIIRREDWVRAAFSPNNWMKAIDAIQFPLVVRPANQGSSIGVSIVKDIKELTKAINQAFFIERIQTEDWNRLSEEEQIEYVRALSDIRSGVGSPVSARNSSFELIRILKHPDNLHYFLKTYFESNPDATVYLEGHFSEQKVVLEGFIEGREFSCVVVQDDNGSPIALPPTEILKGKEVFDYRSKYLAGLSRKLTPIDLPEAQIEAIRKECQRLYSYLEFNVYARIDGFIQEDGTIILNDPNTTSGMLPSSFFFHQAAEIGMNPSQFLTYIIRTSLQERERTSLKFSKVSALLEKLDHAIETQNQLESNVEQVAVILGGYSSERHISVESGRNIYEKLSSSAKYHPIPIFLTGDENSHQLYQLPINLLLKDNADDIRDKVLHFNPHPIIKKIQTEAKNITERFVADGGIFEPHQLDYEWLKTNTDAVFIALHGRPGEDGAVQAELEKRAIPYNGSTSESAAITINKYETLQRLKKAGFTVTDQYLVDANDFAENAEAALDAAEAALHYPLIAKPVDDGCSSAVKKIKNRKELKAFLETIFRQDLMLPSLQAEILGLKPKEEFPIKPLALLETLIEKGDAIHFLEITGGLLTHHNEDGSLRYEVFEPSEALASGEVLSLEEKFLAGEGQNITPARFAVGSFSHEHISNQVRASLEAAAKELGVSGYARIDAFVRVYADGRAETIVIEVNSLPGMTPATCIFHQTAINGYKPADFIDRILEFGKERINLVI